MQLLPDLFPARHRPGIVAIHCSASGPRQWHPYREILGPSVPLVTPELLGYGADPQWAHGTPLTLEDEARHVLASFPRGGPVHLVGHSYGGAVALQAALLAPHRVRSLTLYEPGLFFLLHQDPPSAAAAREIESVERRVDLLVRLGRTADAAESFVNFWDSPATWSAMPAGRREYVARSMSKVCAEFAALRESRIRLDSLKPLPFPVRLLCGETSPATSRRIAQLLRQQWRHARVTPVPGVGHMAPLQHRELMAPLLFSASVEARGAGRAQQSRGMRLFQLFMAYGLRQGRNQ